MSRLHPNLAAGKWQSMTLAEQLGNVGSEFERALNWKQKNQPQYFQTAFDRMLELLDLTISDPRWHNHRLRELCRLRENACQELANPQNPEGLKKYFFNFALLARK